MGQTTADEPASPALARRARGDRTRTALVEAAMALFMSKGVEGTSVDEITSAAAVAKGTFYVHFQHKEDVLLEQAAQVVLTLNEDPLLHDTTVDAVTTLRLLARAFADLHRGRSRPLTGRSIRELVGNREQWLRVLGDRPTLGRILEPIIARGCAEGSIRADLSPARLAQGLTILWLDAIIGWSEREVDHELAEDLARALSLYLDGARVR